MDENYKDTKDRLDHSVAEGMSLPASPDTVAARLTGGIGHILLAWIKSGKQKPVDELFEEIADMVECLQA